MDENCNQAPGEPQFRAILTPHRSLTATGFVILMSALSAISFVTGMVFFTMGAWPVTGFFGLDVLLVYVAFKLSYRSGRLCEIVELTPAKLSLTRVHPSGRREQISPQSLLGAGQLAREARRPHRPQTHVPGPGG